MNTSAILVVDDEQELLDISQETLGNGSRHILTARNGAEALAILRRGGVDLVISDLRMPEMGGMELLRQIQALGLDTDVIILTGYSSAENAVECVKLGAANYLLKPYRIEQLLEAVDKALRERALRNGQARVGNLSRMLVFNNALAGKENLKALFKEFVAQVHETFAPDGVVLFFTGAAEKMLGRHLVVGPYFKDNPSARGWFEEFSHNLLERGRAMLLDQTILGTALGPLCHAVAAPGSAMGVVIPGGNGPMGVVAPLRLAHRQAYTWENLQLLTLFATHLALCLDTHRAVQSLRDTNQEMIHSFVSAVEAKDTYTRGHSDQVSVYAAQLGEALSLPSRELDLLRTAGMLHDIGKIGVPDHILNKPDRLTHEELVIMRRHAATGRSILSKVQTLQDVLPIVYHHHEHVDGGGYPAGLRGEDIPFLARVISVADGYEAMTSDRAYHRARTPREAQAILAAGAGSQWDARVVEAWLAIVREE